MEIMVCAVCGRVLDRHGEYGWMHSYQDRSPQEDHPAIPVLQGEVPDRPRCDFCNVNAPSVILPVRSFEPLTGHVSHGDWAACTTCAQLISTNQWNRLIDRVLSLSAYQDALLQEVLRLRLQRLYRLLRRHISGPQRPIIF